MCSVPRSHIRKRSVHTQDYYSLAGIFSSSRLLNAPLVPDDHVAAYDQGQKKVAELEASIQKQVAESRPKIRESYITDVARYLQAAARLRENSESASKEKRREQLQAVAQELMLNEKFLRRWLRFLSEQGPSIPALKNWNELPNTSVASAAEAAASVESAARQFQTHLELLLKQRNGNDFTGRRGSSAAVRSAG